MDEGAHELEDATDDQPSALEPLNDTELFGLRLAAQVLAHKAVLAGRPRVARWFTALESAIVQQLARRGVGVVVATRSELDLEGADAADRELLADYLGLLAGNDGLSAGQREACRALRSKFVA